MIRGRVSLESVIYFDCWPLKLSYNDLVDAGYAKRYRADHSGNEFVDGRSHINSTPGEARDF